MDRPLYTAALVALYGATAVLVGTLLAPVLVPATLVLSPLLFLFVVALTGVVLTVAGVTPRVPTAATVGLVAVTTVTVGAVATFQEGIASVVGPVPRFVLQGTFAWGGLVAVAAVAIPLAVRNDAWRTVDAATVDRRPLAGAVPDRYADQVPNEVAFRELDARDPAALVFDDGRRECVALTTGGLAVLDDRERDAVLARELTRVVEGSATVSFWASAFAVATGSVARSLVTPTDVTGVGNQARNPHPLAPVAKVVTATVVLAVVYYLPAPILSSLVGWHPAVVAGGLAAVAVLGVLGLTGAATLLARRSARRNVLAADEAGAILAADAEGLGDALRALHADATTVEDATGRGAAANREAEEYEVSVTANGRVTVGDGDRPLDAFGALAVCPTDLVALDDRERALDAVAARLGDGPDDSFDRRRPENRDLQDAHSAHRN